MSRNFGLGSRDIKKAGAFALQNAAREGTISFSTAATNEARWHSFTTWALKKNVKKMELITTDLVKEYGLELAEKIHFGDLSIATAHVYISCVNSVMLLATKGKWNRISATKDCNIPNRCFMRQNAPGSLNRSAYSCAATAVYFIIGARAGATIELMRELGLRSKEASLLDSRRALKQAEMTGNVTIIYGTKGGREREIPINRCEQLAVLKIACQVQGSDRSMIPSNQSWKKWSKRTLADARKLVKFYTDGGLHDLRSAFACEIYEEMMGHAAPAAGGLIFDKNKDLNARKNISKQLGHNRVDIVAEYIGGRR